MERFFGSGENKINLYNPSAEDECNLVAIDSTGISRTNASHYYLDRIGKKLRIPLG